GRRLLLEDVETGRAELALDERLENRALLLHAAARRVHEDRAALHEAERALVDHAARLVGARRVAREQIGLRQQRVQAAHRPGAAPADLIVGDIRVEGEYAHAQRAGELRHEAPDIADADDDEP